MKQRLQTTSLFAPGFLKASATLMDPDVRLESANHEMPVLLIEEGGVTLAIEFPDQEALARFQGRVAALTFGGEPHAD